MLNIATIDLGGERAGATDLRRAAGVAVVLVGCCGLAVPIIKYQLGVSYPIFAIVIALSIAAIAVTSVLLWAQASVTRSVPLSVIAAGYALTAIVMLPYMLFFRNLWPQLAILFSSDAQTSPWLYVAWHVIFIYSTLAYVLVRRHYGHAEPLDAKHFANVRNRISRVAVIVILVTIPPLVWTNGLPMLGYSGQYTLLYDVIAAVIVASAVAAVGVTYWANRFNALLDIWLAIACLSMVADIMMTTFSRQFAVGWYISRLSILLAATAVLFVLLFQTANIYAQLAITAERLRNESLTDALTGLANRRRFDQHFALVLREAMRETRPVALLMLDIDNFKTYNDTYGHQAGDVCLRTIASIVQNNVGRARDLAARTGGEELAVIMPESDLMGALAVAERVRAAVEAAAIAQGRGAVHPIVTVSIGVTATLDPRSSSIEGLISAADEALYRAKSTGRNRIVESNERALVLGVPDA